MYRSIEERRKERWSHRIQIQIQQNRRMERLREEKHRGGGDREKDREKERRGRRAGGTCARVLSSLRITDGKLSDHAFASPR